MAVPKDKANNVLVVSGGSSYQTLDDLIGAAKERPGEVMFGVETGGTVHIQTGLFAKAAGIDVKYVEAGSDTEKLTALVGNSIDACFVNANQAKQYVESGKARAWEPSLIPMRADAAACFQKCLTLLNRAWISASRC